MTGRRCLLGWTLAGFAVMSSRATAEDPLDAARDFISRSGNELAQLAPSANDSEAGRRRLQSFVEQVVDIDSIARFVLGRFWRITSPETQRDYLALFHRVLIKNIIARLGDYSPGKTTVEIGKPTRADTGITVPSVVQRPGNQPVHVNWIVEDDSGTMRVIDVVVEGMSMRLALRSDYSAFIMHNGNQIEPLLKAMRNQLVE